MIATSISIDLIVFFLIVSSMLSEMFIIGEYSISLRRIGISYIMDDIEIPASISISDFELKLCDESMDNTLCPYINKLKIFGELFNFFTIFSLFSLLMSCLHFILVLSVKFRPYKCLSYFHYTIAPTYIPASLVYLYTFYGISTKVIIGFYIVVFTDFMLILQIGFYVYIKNFKNWGLDFLRYNVIDEVRIDDESRESEGNEKQKAEDNGKKHAEMQEKYNQLRAEYEDKGKLLEKERKEYLNQLKLTEESRARDLESKIKQKLLEEFKKNFEMSVNEAAEKARNEAEISLAKAYENKIESAREEGYNRGVGRGKHEMVRDMESKVKEIEESRYRKGYADCQEQMEMKLPGMLKIAEQQGYEKGYEDSARDAQGKAESSEVSVKDSTAQILLEKDNEIKDKSKTINELTKTIKKSEDELKETQFRAKVDKNNYDQGLSQLLQEKEKIKQENQASIERNKIEYEEKIKSMKEDIRLYEIRIEEFSEEKSKLDLIKSSESSLHEMIENLKSHNKTLEDSKETLHLENTALTQKIQGLFIDIQKKDSELETYKSTLSKSEEALANSNLSIDHLREEISVLHSSTELSSSTIEDLTKSHTSKIESIQLELERVLSEKNALDESFKISEENLDKKYSEATINYERQINEMKNAFLASEESLKAKLQALEKEKQDLQSNLTSMLMENHNLSQQIEDMHEDSTAKDKISKIGEMNSLLLASEESLKSKLQATENEKQDLQGNLSSILMEHHSLSQKIEIQESEIAALKAKIKETEEIQNKVSSGEESLRTSLQTTETEKQELQKNLSSILMEHHNFSQKIEDHESLIVTLKGKITEIEETRNKLISSEGSLKSKLEIVEKEKQDLQSNLTSMVMEHHSVSQKLEDEEAEIVSLKAKNLESEKINSEIQGNLRSLLTENSSLQSNLDKYQNQIDDLLSKYKKSEQDKDQIQQALNKKETEVNNLRGKIEAIDSGLIELG